MSSKGDAGWSVEVSEERGVRYLHFGSDYIQGAMRIARPYALELEYTRDLMVPLLLRADDWPRSVLQIGLGSGSVTKFLYRHRPEARITVVEISPEVVAAARQFFKLPDDPQRLRVEIAEGHEYLTTKRRSYDLILVDGFDDRGRPGMLDTLPFYLNCHAHLARNGLLAANLLTRRKSAAPSVARLLEAFDQRVLVIPPTEAGNIVAIGAAGVRIKETVRELRLAAASLKEATGLDLNGAVARIALAQGGTIEL
jgi:spermidine synthase